jgi:hypothetical protein
LEDVAAPAMRPIEPDGVRGLEPAQRFTQVRPPAPDQQVVMVVHQDERVNLRAEPIRQLGHQAQKPPPVFIRAVEDLAAVAPAHHVVPTIGYVDPRVPCHLRMMPEPALIVEYQCLTPLPFGSSRQHGG